MKHLFLLAFAITFITVAKAQISKGSIMIGGYIGYQNSSTDNSDTTLNSYKGSGINIGVSYAKCYKENTFLGVNASYSYSSTTNNTSKTDQKIYGYSIGIFERKYYPIVTNLFLFGQIALNYSYGNSEYKYNTPSVTDNSILQNNIYLNAFPGISYKVSKKIFIEASLPSLLNFGYSFAESKSTSFTQKSNSFVAEVQLPSHILQNLNAGVTIILGK